ncbi:TIGR02217 family protein [Maricaulis sp.]|uniref:phage distal tail protein, Rcc01695 family n=1 Tax=Maricaulis sp. TaxID=1486257 RepID=UPI003A927BFF
MSVFHEVRFPFSVSVGASGGPERRTEIVPLVSGREQRNTPWADSRRRYDAGPGVRSLTDIHTLIEFFEARRGPLHGFRFRDPFDNRSAAPDQAPDPSDQLIGTGDGTATQFQLVKHYESGGEAWTRTITKPVEGSVRLAVDGVETLDFSLDPATGLVTLTDPPGPGQAITAGFAFDVPVRFASERLDLALDEPGAASALSIPLIEIRA